MGQQNIKIGLVQEEAVKKILEEQGWTVNIALSTGRPIDVYASYHGRLGILCEVKNNDPDYPYVVPTFSKRVFKTISRGGQISPANLSQIWRADKLLKQFQIKKALFKPYIKVIVCNKTNNGSVAYNQFNNIFFVEYNYFPLWLKRIPLLFLGDPSLLFNVE